MVTRIRTESRELAACRARVIRREQELQRDAYRHMSGRHITDIVIGCLGAVVAVGLLAAGVGAGWIFGAG